MTELNEKIDAILNAVVAPGEPGAAVAVLRDGDVLHCKGHGLANVEWDIPIAPDTVFRIGSLTKQFTAAAIMMLKERGLVALDAPLETTLPDFPVHGRRITARHLLNHTSGVATYTTLAEYASGKAQMHTPLKALVARIAALPFDFEPGERWLYSNSGYVLLGAIIERVSGMKYRDFLAREIFAPLGMAQTHYVFDEPIVPHRAAGYQRGKSGIENASYVSPTYYHAAGGLGSSVLDLAKWDCAVRAHRVVSADSLEEMLQLARLSDGSDYPYGYGWGIADYRGSGRRLFHHAGGVSGFACHMLHFRDEALTTIVLSNLYQFPFDRITREVLRAVFGEGPAVATPHALPPHLLEACAGTFRPINTTTGTAARTLVVADGGLTFAEPGGPHLIATGDAQFCEKADPMIEYVFSELMGEAYQRFVFSTPLFPPTTYVRAPTSP